MLYGGYPFVDCIAEIVRMDGTNGVNLPSARRPDPASVR